MEELAAKHDWIGEVRGTGAFWAIELVADRASREPLAIESIVDKIGAKPDG